MQSPTKMQSFACFGLLLSQGEGTEQAQLSVVATRSNVAEAMSGKTNNNELPQFWYQVMMSRCGPSSDRDSRAVWSEVYNPGVFDSSAFRISHVANLMVFKNVLNQKLPNNA